MIEGSDGPFVLSESEIVAVGSMYRFLKGKIISGDILLVAIAATTQQTYNVMRTSTYGPILVETPRTLMGAK